MNKTITDTEIRRKHLLLLGLAYCLEHKNRIQDDEFRKEMKEKRISGAYLSNRSVDDLRMRNIFGERVDYIQVEEKDFADEMRYYFEVVGEMFDLATYLQIKESFKANTRTIFKDSEEFFMDVAKRLVRRQLKKLSHGISADPLLVFSSRDV
jgi:hypothetical protein